VTVTNVIELDGTPFQANDVWYSPPMRESSFVQQVSIRMNADGSADVKYTLDSGEYEYKTAPEFAKAVWTDLYTGNSPGLIYSNLRDYVRNNPWTGTKVPEANWTISVTGPASKVDLLIQHLQAAGFTVE
jgi:hypothetical protein